MASLLTSDTHLGVEQLIPAPSEYSIIPNMNRYTEHVPCPRQADRGEFQRTQLWPWVVASCPLFIAIIKMVLDLVYFIV